MGNFENAEALVEDILEKNKRSRKDDWILYGTALHRCGVDIKNISLYDFILKRKELEEYSFKTIERCRRKVQARRQELVDSGMAVKREDAEEDYKNYGRK